MSVTGFTAIPWAVLPIGTVNGVPAPPVTPAATTLPPDVNVTLCAPTMVMLPVTPVMSAWPSTSEPVPCALTRMLPLPPACTGFNTVIVPLVVTSTTPPMLPALVVRPANAPAATAVAVYWPFAPTTFTVKFVTEPTVTAVSSRRLMSPVEVLSVLAAIVATSVMIGLTLPPRTPMPVEDSSRALLA